MIRALLGYEAFPFESRYWNKDEEIVVLRIHRTTGSKSEEEDTEKQV